MPLYKAFQTVKYPLPSTVFTLGTRFVTRFRDLQTTYFNRLAHLWRYSWQIPLAETFGAGAGGTVVSDNAGFASRIEFFDGQSVRFTGSGVDLRDFERLEGSKVNDGLHNAATTIVRHWRRHLNMGPPNTFGSPTDWVIPVGALENGEMRLNTGAATDFEANVTAVTGTIENIAEMVLLDEIRIPPFYDRTVYGAAGADWPIMGKGLYCFVGAARIAARTAYTTGQLGAITIDTGQGQVVPGINAWDLSNQWNSDFDKSELGGLIGDPATATDTGQRTILLDGTVGAQLLDLQPYLWVPQGGRVSKMAAMVESSLRVRHSGTLATGTEVLLVGRVLPQTPTVIGAMADKATRQLGWKSGVLSIKLEDKRPQYKGPIPWAFPYTLKQAA